MKRSVLYLAYLRKLFMLVPTILCIVYTVKNTGLFEITLDDEVVLLSKYSVPYYEMLTDNTGYTNINGISNFVNNLYNEGYFLYKDNSTNEYIDYIFKHDDEEISWRVYYSFKDEYIAFFSSDYESSARGYLYIVEEY